MRTLKEISKIIQIGSLPNRTQYNFCVGYEIHVIYNRNKYWFRSSNWQAANRISRRKVVNDKVTMYGYTLKGAYEAFYKEFKKKKAAGTLNVV